MSKYTEGEWAVEYENSDNRSGGQWYVVGPAEIRFSYGASDEQRSEAEANARLISQAPAMHAKLKKAISGFIDYPAIQKIMDKVEGEV